MTWKMALVVWFWVTVAVFLIRPYKPGAAQWINALITALILAGLGVLVLTALVASVTWGAS